MMQQKSEKGDLSNLIRFHKPSQTKFSQARKAINAMNVQNETEWWATKGDYQKLRMADLFASIAELHIQKLGLWSNHLPRILIDCRTIKFPELKEISIAWNGIASIEVLREIDFPSLIDLDLRQNHITEVRSLRCLNFPQMKNLSLRGNHIKEIVDLTELRGNSIKHINLNANKILTNIKDFIRIQSPKITTISITKNLLIVNNTESTFVIEAFARFRIKGVLMVNPQELLP